MDDHFEFEDSSERNGITCPRVESDIAGRAEAKTIAERIRRQEATGSWSASRETTGFVTRLISYAPRLPLHGNVACSVCT